MNEFMVGFLNGFDPEVIGFLFSLFITASAVAAMLFLALVIFLAVICFYLIEKFERKQ